MNETPWQMWDLPSASRPQERGTEECRAVLEQAFNNVPAAWDHPGLLHLYVHLMEMSPFPQLALRAGDRLREIVPELAVISSTCRRISMCCAGITMTCSSIISGTDAGPQVPRLFGRSGRLPAVRHPQLPLRDLRRDVPRRYTPAITAAEELIATVPEAVLRITSPPMADFLEGYLTMKQHVLVRFGKWREIIEQKLPEDRDLYCSNVAMLHYAKAVAHSALGNVAEAEAEKALFMAAKTRVPESRLVHNNTVVYLLGVAEAMLDGELEYRKGNYDTAFAHCAGRSSSATRCPMTSPGAGCSRPAMRWARYSWSRAGSRRPRRSTAPISALTAS